ncbi:MAG: hypothetical protein ABGX25_02410 [Nautiliaceae bacterium]
MSIIYLQKEYIYIYENGKIERKEFTKEKGIITTTISYKDVYHMGFKLPKNLSKEMLLMEAEKYVFTEGGLDYEKQYKINYYFQELEDNYYVDAFVVDIDNLKKLLAPYLETYKYIDFISLGPFVFESFYEMEKVSSRVDVFVYFSKDDAYMSCFKEGKFVFCKGLSKLSSLANTLNISADEVVDILVNKGLDSSLYDKEEIFNEINNFFSQLFMRMNTVINYSVNFYQLGKIDRIYFYSSFNIKNFFETFSDFWNLSGVDFKKYPVKSEYDAFDVTATYFNALHYDNEDLNFSIFKRPPPFYKRETGKLLILSGIVILGVGIDIAYKYLTINKLQKEISVLEVKYNKKVKELDVAKKEVDKLKKKIKFLQKENNEIMSQINYIDKKISKLYLIAKQPPFTNYLAQIMKLLKKYHLKIANFNYNEGKFKVTVVSSYDNSANIALFMQDLLNLKYKKVSSKEISNKNGTYTSQIVFERKK